MITRISIFFSIFSFDLRDEIPDKEGKIWAKDNPYSEGTDKGKELLAQVSSMLKPFLICIKVKFYTSLTM